MDTNQFSEFIEDQSKLSKISVQELKDQIVKFPYSANLRVLLAKKCHMEGRKDFDKMLSLAATYAIDRNHLFHQFQLNQNESVTDNYSISEEFIALSDLSAPSASAPPQEEESMKQSGFEFVEPDVEEIPLVLDLESSVDETPEASHANDDEAQIPLKDLLTMEENKNDALGQDEKASKKSIIFIEDLMSSKKDSKKEPETPVVKKNDEQKTIDSKTEEDAVESTTPKTEEVIPKEEVPQDSVLGDQQADEPSTLENRTEELTEEPEFPIDLGDDIKPTEKSISPSPKPKTSFSSWLKQFDSPRLSIRNEYQRVKNEKEVVPPKEEKFIAPKKERTKGFAAKSFRMPDDLVSETLAKLHVKQGNYEEALEMYKKLCLIFPEKKTFFAEQIEKLKNL